MLNYVITIRYPNLAAFPTINWWFIFSIVWTFGTTHFRRWPIAYVRQAHTGMSLRMQHILFLGYVVLLNVIKISLINTIGISEGNASSFWRHITLKVFVVIEARVTVDWRDVGLLLNLINCFFWFETGGTFVAFRRSLLA